jgi:flagellar basal body-associated protein FliL
MAEAENKDAPAEGEAPAPKGPSKLPLIVLILSMLSTIAVAGVIYYTRVLYKRPPITESAERKRLLEAAEEAKKLKIKPDAERDWIRFEKFQANLKPKTKSDGGLRLYYVNMEFSLQIADKRELQKFEEVRPKFTDELIQTLTKKEFDEITTVQGRYLLRLEMQDLANKLLQAPLITSVEFTQFQAQ